MTTRPPHDAFGSPQPQSERSAVRTTELLPIIDQAERDDASMRALLLSANEADARLIGRALGERVSMLVRERSYGEAARLLERVGSLSSASKERLALSGGLDSE